MKVSTIMNLLNAKCFTEISNKEMDCDITYAFACDLMSDVLAYVNEDILLITGLSHVQTLRTAEMLDIRFILYVRGKQPDEMMLEMAKQNNMILLGSTLTTYEASGILYEAGLKSLKV
ncbi:MAG: transcriptional regulator [Turicibacter sp.]